MNLISGTLHFVVYGARRVIICSDGSAHDRNGRIPGFRSVKLHNAGKYTTVGTVGAANLPIPSQGTDWPVSRFVRRVCDVEEIRDKPLRLLWVIRRLLYPIFELMQAERQWDSLHEDAVTAFEAFTVTRSRTGRVSIMSLNIPLLTSQAGRRSIGEPVMTVWVRACKPTQPYHMVFGTELPPGYRLPNPDDDLPDEVLLSRIDRVFALAERASAYIGPPYDVAVIDDNGFRWVRRQTEV